MSTFDINSAVGNVASFYEALTPLSLTRIDAFYAECASFKDPFNEVRGLPAISRIFEHMFETVEAPHFVVNTTIAQGRQAMLAWEFHLVVRARTIVIRGVSHLEFDERGLVVTHRDYWDAAEELYARLPIVGGLMRLLRRKLSATEG